MMRSGSTLQFQIIAHLVEEAGLGKRLGWTPPPRFPEVREQYTDYPGWKVFKVHVCTRPMRAEFNRGNASGVYIFRDIRDVMVSAMRRQSKSFEQLWQENYIGVCLRNFYKWTRLPGVLVSKYEQMILDVPAEVSRIAAHLGIAIDDATCEKVAAEYAITKQKERIELFRSALAPEYQSGQDPIFDAVTLLHINHIHSGQTGEWKLVLSPSQISLIEGEARDWLVTNGYEVSQINPVPRVIR